MSISLCKMYCDSKTNSGKRKIGPLPNTSVFVFKISEQQRVWIIRTSYLNIYCNSNQKCIPINEYANYPSASLTLRTLMSHICDISPLHGSECVPSITKPSKSL